MTDRYDRIARGLHWAVAGLVLVQFATGWSWGFFDRGTEPRFYLFRLHLYSGYGVLALAVLRIAWRLTHRAPALPEGLSRVTRIAAHATHGLLYLAILVQPILGAITVTALGKQLGTGPVHVVLAYLIAGLVALHVGAALWHHFVRRDGLVRRMLP
ncbi:cytochrome b561 [Angulomicrobium tetraedrale]|uniref:Cytochrome b561 n=1 Tax=Ancylobacter tetraedralis TaxID=217068 RepID=A0A839Z7W6_9HYPH|nr:cytochrome b [Ancylobacter tetraedralis]MBB3770860.1 cytochrome b561 [Ancylobacter tetraedralis]